MRHYIGLAVTKLITFVISILLIFTVTFLVFEMVPGKFYDGEEIKNSQTVSNLINRYDLGASIGVRYVRSLQGLWKFDFGVSYVDTGQPVRQIIMRHAPISLATGLLAILLSVLVSVPLSLSVSTNRRLSRWFDIVAVIVLSVPVFVVAVLAQFIFGVRADLLPISGVDSVAGYILPVVVLSLAPATILTQILTHNMCTVRQSLYVLAAQARGLAPDSILVHYVLKNSLTAALTYLAPMAAGILAGSFVVESVFGVPGLGRYFVTSITNRDYPVIAGLTVFYSVILIGLNFLASLVVEINDRRRHLWHSRAL